MGSYIVMDWYTTSFYGPFITKEEAEEWLAQQGIYEERYDQEEVSIHYMMRPSADRLSEIK